MREGNWYEERCSPDPPETRHVGRQPYTRRHPKDLPRHEIIGDASATSLADAVSTSSASYVHFEQGGLRAPRVYRAEGVVRQERMGARDRSMGAVQHLYGGERRSYNEQREKPWGVLPSRALPAPRVRAASEPVYTIPGLGLEPSYAAGVTTRLPASPTRNIITNCDVVDASDYAARRGKRHVGAAAERAPVRRSLLADAPPAAGSSPTTHARRSVFMASVSPAEQSRKAGLSTFMDWP